MRLYVQAALAASLGSVQHAVADGDYLSHATAALKTLQLSWYNEQSGLWIPSMGWWNSANGMTTIANLAAIDRDTLPQATRIFSDAYMKAPAYNPKNQVSKTASSSNIFTTYGIPPGSMTGTTRKRNLKIRAKGGNADGFVNSCYDDNGWWALAWIAAWDLTGNGEYIDTAKGIFDQMSGGGPTKCNNGGIIWCSGQDDYVNAISNELYLSVAAHLATRDPDSKYLEAAERQWSWFKASGMMNSDNLINDGLTSDCQNNGQTAWTYNQGVILGGLAELSRAKKDSSYLDSAHTIASAAISHFADGNKVIHESCEPSCAPDGTQFKGAFIRNLMELHRASPKEEYSNVIRANADSIWTNNRNDRNQFSVDWGGPFIDPANASTHTAAMDALVAAVALG